MPATPPPVDLRSDTVTRPTPAMRDAMAAAEVGDDVYGEDPTVNALERRCAELTGKQAAIFAPSGTMANQLGVRAWAGAGAEVYLHRDAHLLVNEGGGIAALWGAQTRAIGGGRGRPPPPPRAPHRGAPGGGGDPPPPPRGGGPET